MYQDELPPEVVLSIQRVFELQMNGESAQSLDVLSNDFNPLEALNNIFPNEASLENLDTVQVKLANDQVELKKDVEALERGLQQNHNPERMQSIQEMISDLLGQMSRIREKATESEAVVKSITKDIQVLDLAKKNLILSMTTLKRLQMLVNALTQLDDLIVEKKYADIAQTLSAVKQISASFKPYTSVPRIAQIWKRMQEVQGKLRTQVDQEFDNFYLQDPAKQVKPSVVSDACLVVDVLGDDTRAHIVDRYVALELKEYRRIFRTTDEAGQLDNISRRFAWFRRLLQSHEIEQGRVFPSEWKVGCLRYFRDDIAGLLAKMGASLTVKSLLDNLLLVLEFEASMSKKWATPAPQLQFSEILTASGGIPNSQPTKSIGSAFEPHMGIFVDAQDRSLSDMLAQHRKGSKAQPRSSLEAEQTKSMGDEHSTGSPIVLPSSTELFYFYAQSLEQCAKLSTGKPLFDLCQVHKKWLRIYAEDVLIANLKRPPNQGRKSADTRHDLALLKQSCIVLNTADYCQTTALELEEKVKEKIDTEHKEKVTLQEERDLFVSVISTGIAAQLRELEFACDPAFTSMARTSWNSVNQVSGQSAYADELVKAAEQVIEAVKPLVEQKRYVRNLLDKACSLLLSKFTNSLVKSRPLKEIGAEQLLIDLQVLKAYLQKMPGEALLTTSYTRGLVKSTTRLEALLKVIVTPVDPPEGFILNYTLLIGDASFSNFQKILDLKGTPKGEQNDLLDSFLTTTSTKPELESTSFLSSLDMDPSSSAHPGGSLMSPGGSRVSLPCLTSPTVATSGSDGSSVRGNEPRREVFSDFKRFVSFGLRKDSQGP
ncbi:Vps53-like protein [Infundibulicybe gibba]|nr:Vps53-like protein [Infundibulicybe gibba]